MTSEDDFQRLLDSNWEDNQTRLVFADWLQDRSECRADGYRALVALDRRLAEIKPCSFWYNTSDIEIIYGLPTIWYDLLIFEGKSKWCCPYWDSNRNATRRELEDAAALAFSLLPYTIKQQLLAGNYNVS